MSTPKAEPVEIQFNRGLRQELEANLLPPGALTTCLNLEFDKLGRLRRRDGFTAIGTSSLSKTNAYADPTRRIGTGANGEQVLFTDNNAFCYLPAQDKVCEAGQNNQVSCLRASLTGYFNVGGDQAGTVLFADCAQTATYYIVAYTQLMANAGTYSVLCDVIDIATGARVISGLSIASGASSTIQPRVIVVSNIAFVLHCVTASTQNIDIGKIDLSGSTIPAYTGNAALITDADVNNQIFDVAPSQGGFVVAYRRKTGGGAIVGELKTFSTALANLASFQWLTYVGSAAWSASAIGVCGADSAADLIYAVGYDPSSDLMELVCSSYDLATNTQGNSTTTLFMTASPVRQIIVGRIDSTHAAVGWSECFSADTNAVDPRGHFHLGRMQLNVSAQLTYISTFANYTIGTKFVQDTGGTLYALGRYENPNQVYLAGSTNLQSHYLLLDFGQASAGFGKPTPVAHVSDGHLIFHSNGANPGIGGACISGTNALLFVAPINIGTTPAAGQQVGCWRGQALGEDRYLNVAGHGALFVAGATPLAYDGQRLVELSFYSFPCAAAGHATASNAGGSMVAGVYQYRFVYEWTDAAGNRHQSPACPAISVTVGGATTGSVAWTLPPLMATRKQVSPATASGSGAEDIAAPVRMVCYRTTIGPGPVFYLTGVVGVNVTTNPATRTDVPTRVAFTDTAVDTSITGNEILYERNGGKGKLSSNAPPPSAWVSIHNGRLWGLDIENPERIWCTKLFEVGEAPGYNPALQVLIPNSGELQGVIGQDDKLYAFGTGGTFIGFYGGGPDNTGNGGFPDPVLISPKITCDDPRGIIQGDDGIYFTGPDHWGTGVYLLRRGNSNPISIGLRARDELATCPIIHGAAYNQYKARMEFLFVDNDLIPATVMELYYHYDLLDEEQIGQWTKADFSNSYAAHAIGMWLDPTLGHPVPVISYTGSQNGLAKQTNIAGPLDLGIAGSNLWTLVTGDLRAAGMLAWQELFSLTLLATKRDAHTAIVEFDISYDSGQNFTDTQQFFYTETTNAPALRHWEQQTKKLANAAGRVRLQDILSESTQSLGLILHGMTLEAIPLGGIVRLPAGSNS